eukprot:COSAG01_NODE_7667_length_3106_cov_6.205520_1_plen_610_part_10
MDQAGLIPRVFDYLFSTVAQKQDEVCTAGLSPCKCACESGAAEQTPPALATQGKCTVKITCSYLEIYNETFTDLLNPGGIVKLHEDARRRMGVQVEGAAEIPVNSAAETFEILSQGSQYRHVAATNMNKESSRSHSVFTLKIQTAESKNGTKSIRTSRFNLIDLAGSERQKQAKTEGAQLKEASSINKSLSALGNVINALVDNSNGKDRHIHYRDSKLTFLLKDSLGGNSKTCIIANVSPAGKNSEETLSTLMFAKRAKCIKNAAVVNENTTGDMVALQARLKELQEENETLKQSASSEPAVQQTQSEAEMERLLAQGLADRARLKEEMETLTEHLVTTNANAAAVVKAVQAKDMVIKFRDGEISQLKKRLGGDKSQYEFEHSAELETLRKFREKNPELRKALYEMKHLQKQVKEAQDNAKYQKEVEELREYNDGLQKQCAKFITEKDKLESDFKEVEELAEGLAAKTMMLTSDNSALQDALEKLGAAKAELETMIGQTMNMLETSQVEVTSLKSEIAQAVVDNTGLQLKCDTISADHDTKVAELTQSQGANQQLRDQIEDLTRKMAEAEAEATKVQTDLNEQIASLTDTNAETTAALEKEQATVAEHES